jgi:hypothetical protein
MSINGRLFEQARLAEELLQHLPTPARVKSDLMAFGLVIAPEQIETLRGLLQDTLEYEKRSNNYDAHWGGKKVLDGHPQAGD